MAHRGGRLERALGPVAIIKPQGAVQINTGLQRAWILGLEDNGFVLLPAFVESLERLRPLLEHALLMPVAPAPHFPSRPLPRYAPPREEH